MIGSMANGLLHPKTTLMHAIAILLMLVVFCGCSHKQQETPLDWIKQVPVFSNDANSPEYEQRMARLRHPDDKTLQSLMELVRAVGKSGSGSTNADDYLPSIYRAFEIIGTNAAPLIPELRREFLAANACAAYGLAQIGGDAWGILFDGLTNSDAKVRISAVMAMAYARDTNAVSALPYLKSFLSDNSTSMRSIAAGALGRLSVSANSKLPSLIQAARTDTNLVVRAAAVMAIAVTGTNSAEVQDVLKQIGESDSSPSVRLAARQAIKKLAKLPSN
jgi:hypothetical protein